MEILQLLAQAFLQHGAIGLLAATGWALAGWFLYRDHKRKEEQEGLFKERDDLLREKDKELTDTRDKLTAVVTEMSDKRITDLKEITSEFRDLSNMTIQTLEKLTVALEVKNRRS